jgi:hypothetical protein
MDSQKGLRMFIIEQFSKINARIDALQNEIDEIRSKQSIELMEKSTLDGLFIVVDKENKLK